MDGPTTRVRLRVIPRAPRSEIVGRQGDAWKLRVTAPPERGQANDAVRDLLTSALGISRERVELVTGAGSRDKVVTVRGLTARDTEQRLASAISSDTGGGR